MPEATAPVSNRLEADRLKVFFAVLFPVSPGIGVPVKGKVKWYHWASVLAVPMLGPLVARQLYPILLLRVVNFGLGIRLPAIGCLDTVAQKAAISIGTLGSLHSGGAGVYLLEERRLEDSSHTWWPP